MSTPFTREELQSIRDRALAGANEASATPTMQRQLLVLADAADHIEAILSRASAVTAEIRLPAGKP